MFRRIIDRHPITDQTASSGRPGSRLLAALGLREAQAQHTQAEERLLTDCARGRRMVVELGVAEGASAFAMRRVIDPAGQIVLIDPYPDSRIPGIRLQEIIARRLVGSVSRGRARFIRGYSQDVLRHWTSEIDLVFIDADHRYEMVKADWVGWTAHLAADGLGALHDARIFPSRGIGPQDGPVRLCEELRRSPNWTVIAEVDSLVILRPA